jgi:hypothetical protein
MILEYKYIVDFLTAEQESTLEPALKYMLEKMLVKVNTYLNEAIKCEAIVLATVLNPCFRLSMFQMWFPKYYKSTEQLLREVYNQQKSELHADRHLPESTPPIEDQPRSNNRRQNIPQTDFFPSSGKTPVVDKLTIYIGGKYKLEEEDQFLAWWKVSCSFPLCFNGIVQIPIKLIQFFLIIIQEHFKAHYVARGFNQCPRQDCGNTYAPTASLATLRLLLSISVQKGYTTQSFDVSSAYLYSPIDKEVYVKPPTKL